ncbi:uncharacterized protein Z520_08207 [Fonsecaea multimorphosa CBS 102226]|uniref:Uncharacterized protein n=1 Tax=Fonsecaea multimorphosa CBS 102226 TaxID=1442371 RepID=A0A0D2JRD2_9EURO|nr:uncharacterized protein Z520_08207 [Fonsecaea multimorphosa CBS 102226]KIX95952.1 hypothetical protein Z520_08207 [Fonsecaea multimorphosa CBS 102226]OAL21723.1 hypothetical protein AYO22_07665 [Fonsecaea multimorphosa]
MSAMPSAKRKTPSTYSCDSSSSTGSTMEMYSEEFIEKARAQQAQADPVLVDLDTPPEDLLADPDSNRGRRLRLIEEARRDRLQLEEQQKEAVRRATEQIEASMTTPQKTSNPEQGSKSKRRRNRGRGNRSGRDGSVADQQSALSQRAGSPGAIQEDPGLQGESLPWDVQPVPASSSFIGESLHQTASGIGRQSRNPFARLMVREYQGLTNSPGGGLQPGALYGPNLQEPSFQPRAEPHNVETEQASLPSRWPLARGVFGRRHSSATGTASDDQTCFSRPSSLVPHSLPASRAPDAGSTNTIVQDNEDILRRGPPFFGPTRAAEAEHLSQAQHTRNDWNLQQEIAWERDALWRILRQQFGLSDSQIRALLENEKNGRGDPEWVSVVSSR